MIGAGRGGGACATEIDAIADETTIKAAPAASLVRFVVRIFQLPPGLSLFSCHLCRSKFPVAADPNETVIKSYDAVLAEHPEYANRTSYVIAPDHSVLLSYTDMNPDKHVELTLAAVKKWRDTQVTK